MFRRNSLKLPFGYVTDSMPDGESSPTPWELRRYDADGAALCDSDRGCDDMGFSRIAQDSGELQTFTLIFSTVTRV